MTFFLIQVLASGLLWGLGGAILKRFKVKSLFGTITGFVIGNSLTFRKRVEEFLPGINIACFCMLSLIATGSDRFWGIWLGVLLLFYVLPLFTLFGAVAGQKLTDWSREKDVSSEQRLVDQFSDCEGGYFEFSELIVKQNQQTIQSNSSFWKN